MAEVYDEVEIEDMDFNDEDMSFYFACPCGDQFRISLVNFRDILLIIFQKEMVEKGNDIAICPSCSLTLRIIYDKEDLDEYKEDDYDTSDEDE